MSDKVKFRDIKNYPVEFQEAAYFCDEFDDEPDGAFFAIAEERGLYDQIIELAKWEKDNVDFSEVK